MTTEPPPPLTDADYHAMEVAISETARGRGFLAEHARRARAADTRLLLSALERIEGGASRVLASEPNAAPEPEASQDPWAAIRAMNEDEKIAMCS